MSSLFFLPQSMAAPNARSTCARWSTALYILSTGCQWRTIPKDLTPKSNVYDYFDLWDWMGRSTAYMRRFTSNAVKQWGARRARQPRSLTARASRAPKKGDAH